MAIALYDLTLLAIAYVLTVTLVVILLFAIVHTLNFQVSADGRPDSRLLAAHIIVWLVSATAGGALVGLFGVWQPSLVALALVALLLYVKWHQSQRCTEQSQAHELSAATAAAVGVILGYLLMRLEHWHIYLPIQF